MSDMRFIDPDSTGQPAPQDATKDGPGQVEGQANMRLLSRDGRILLHLGRPCLWVGFTKDEAYKMADGLRQLASKL